MQGYGFVTFRPTDIITYTCEGWHSVCVTSEVADKTEVPEEQRLFQQLLADCEPAVRPVYNSSQPVFVHFELGLHRIVDLVRRLFCFFFSNHLLFLLTDKMNIYFCTIFSIGIYDVSVSM